jgi:putative tryptophan/tyrosine transport system substrate-binding protein
VKTPSAECASRIDSLQATDRVCPHRRGVNGPSVERGDVGAASKAAAIVRSCTIRGLSVSAVAVALEVRERHSRRAFIRCAAGAGLGAAGLALLDACGLLPAATQPGRLARVGVLAYDDGTGTRWVAFRRGLRELGWIEGQNLTLDWRLADAHGERLPGLAAELVGMPPDVLVAGGTQAALAAQQATSTIPIVMPALNDPVGSGLVASFGRPGGNATGSALLSPEVAPKWVELLQEVLPTLRRVAALASVDNPSRAPLIDQIQAAGSRLGLQVRVFEIHAARELDSVIEAAATWPADALIVLPDLLFFTQRTHLADLVVRSRLPAIYPSRDYTDAGGLLSYGADVVDLYHRAAGHVDKILRGAHPADLPMQQPATFELAVNQQTLQAQAMTIPESLTPLVTEWIQ